MYLEFGVGFKWQPSTLDIDVNDQVFWKWSRPDHIYALYSVRETDVTGEVRTDGFSAGQRRRDGKTFF